LEDSAEDAGLNHAADCSEQALAKLRIAEDRVSTELSRRLERWRLAGCPAPNRRCPLPKSPAYAHLKEEATCWCTGTV